MFQQVNPIHSKGQKFEPVHVAVPYTLSRGDDKVEHGGKRFHLSEYKPPQNNVMSGLFAIVTPF